MPATHDRPGSTADLPTCLSTYITAVSHRRTRTYPNLWCRLSKPLVQMPQRYIATQGAQRWYILKVAVSFYMYLVRYVRICLPTHWFKVSYHAT